MSALTTKLRTRRESARNRRALNHAIDSAASRTMRDELIIAAQRNNVLR